MNLQDTGAVILSRPQQCPSSVSLLLLSLSYSLTIGLPFAFFLPAHFVGFIVAFVMQLFLCIDGALVEILSTARNGDLDSRGLSKEDIYHHRARSPAPVSGVG